MYFEKTAPQRYRQKVLHPLPWIRKLRIMKQEAIGSKGGLHIPQDSHFES